MCPAPTKQKYAFGVQEMTRRLHLPRLDPGGGCETCDISDPTEDAREDGGESLSVISSSSSKDGDGDVKCLGKLEAILEYVHFTEDGDNVGGGLRDKDDV
ncbi:hypothetical protein N7470_005331 [Penicillium chermesinum]|nr:hypothetical protein N7470_005331 [Penicillium chermesinum]